MKQINAAIVIRSFKNTDLFINEFAKAGIILSIYKSIIDLKNTGHYDIVLVHEHFVNEIETKVFVDMQLLILTESMNVSEVFLRVKNLSVYTVIQWPSDVDSLKLYVEKAYEHLIEKKSTNASKAIDGKTIAITAFANGSGKTLLSYNLAAKLTSFIQADSVCLVDMNIPFSAAKALLNVQDNYNWNSIRPILKEGKPSKQKIRNIVYSTKYNFSLLSGPTDLESNKQLTLDEVINLQKGLTEMYQVSLYDYHTIVSKEDLEFIRNADMTLAIVDLKSLSILQAVRTLTYIREKEPDLLNKMKFVFNGIDSTEGKTSELVQTKLGIEPFGTIDKDYEAIEKIIENGELFTDKSLLIDSQIYNLAEKIIKELF